MPLRPLRSAAACVAVRLLGAALVLATLAGGAPAQQLPDPAAALATVRCAQAIHGGGTRFANRRLRLLDACVTGALKCVQTKPGDALCAERARKRCTEALAKASQVESAKFAALVGKRCAPGAVDFATLMSEDGAGYDLVAAQCLADFGVAIDDVEGLTTCLISQHERASDRLFAAEEPRARELISALGVALPATSDLPDNGGSGTGVNDPKGAGTAIQRCAGAISKAGARFVGRKLGALDSCAAKVFTCVQTAVQTALPGKAEKIAATDCMPQLTATCGAQLTRLEAEKGRLSAAIAKKCGAAIIPFAALAATNATNLTVLAAECATFGVPTLATLADYQECLYRQHACRAEDLLLFEVPRAQELVAYMTRQLRSDFCPDSGVSALKFVESHFHVVGTASGLDGGRAVAVSPDGAHVYVASFNDDSLAVFTRDPATGSLTFVEAHFDAVDGVDGLNGARAVTVSPDGANVYVASSRDDAVAFFARDASTGALTFIGRKKNGAGVLDSLNGARALALSPDGANVYVAADPSDAIAVFSRDPATGVLTFIQSQKNLTDGVEGLLGPYAVAVSPDGAHVYAASFGDDAIAIFSRDPDDGTLAYVGNVKNGVDDIDGLDGVRALALSPDGAFLYAAGSLSRAVAVFARDADSGELTPVTVRRHIFAAADGLTQPDAIAVSADGARVYTASAFDNVIGGFTRDPDTGRLTLRASQPLSIGRETKKPGVLSLTVTPDGSHVYVTESKHDLLEAFRVLP